jgi:hypothetical protein
METTPPPLPPPLPVQPAAHSKRTRRVVLLWSVVAVVVIVFGLKAASLFKEGFMRGWNDARHRPEVEASFAAHMKDVEQRYGDAAKTADFGTLFHFTWLTDKSLIGPRRIAVQNAKSANAELRRAVDEGEADFRRQLKQAGVSDSASDQAVASFHQARVAKLPLVLKIRDLDEQMMVDALTLLDLLETQWGRWIVQDGRIVFTDDDTLVKFNSTIEAVQVAGKEQVDYQRQLSALGK